MSNALQRRYGRSHTLTAGTLVQFIDVDGVITRGRVVEQVDTDGKRFLRIMLEADPDEPSAAAPIVEVPAADVTKAKAKKSAA